MHRTVYILLMWLIALMWLCNSCAPVRYYKITGSVISQDGTNAFYQYRAGRKKVTVKQVTKYLRKYNDPTIDRVQIDKTEYYDTEKEWNDAQDEKDEPCPPSVTYPVTPLPQILFPEPKLEPSHGRFISDTLPWPEDIIWAYDAKGACMVRHNETGIFVSYLPNTLAAAKSAERHLLMKVKMFKASGRQRFGIHGECGYDHEPKQVCVF
jgi:hypothetical protein